MYDYREHIMKDIRDYIADNVNLDEYRGRRDDLEQDLNDDLWVVDSVIGNVSGSYFCNAYKAEEALCHNWDLLVDAIEEFGGNFNVLRKGPEACDVTIRCYLLGECIFAVLDEFEDNSDLDELDGSHN